MRIFDQKKDRWSLHFPLEILTKSAVRRSLHSPFKIWTDSVVRGKTFSGEGGRIRPGASHDLLFRPLDGVDLDGADLADRDSLHPSSKIRTDSVVRGSLSLLSIGRVFGRSSYGPSMNF